MAKLESAAEVIALIKTGKYANKVNCQRGVGRTRLSKPEKDKVLAFIDTYFPDDGSTPAAKAGKKKVAAKKFHRMAKVAKKKKASKLGTTAPAELTDGEEDEAVEDLDVDAPDEEESEEEEVEEVAAPRVGKKAKKKAASRKAHGGTLPISPSEVKTVADVLSLVDSTVKSSVSIINALKAAHEVSQSGDINRGIEHVKLALDGVAHLLHQSVVVPLANTTTQADPEVTGRLNQIVAASERPDLNSAPPVYVPPPLPGT